MASLSQSANLIALTGTTNTVFLQGEPGIGKSSILKMMEAQHGDKYQYIYADCPLMDLPDFAMPMVDQETKTTHFAPSSLWGFNDPRPKMIMLDEVSKAPNVVKPMFTRLMLERCIGEFKLPEGSMVFATGNNASDGVGDTMQGHINNRVTRIPVAKPSSEAFIDWGISNGVDEVILTIVHKMPHLMNSYIDDPENLYIFNPKRNTGAFASPRSLTKAGYIVAQRALLGSELTQEALAGTVGLSLAGDIVAFALIGDSLPEWDAIKKNPAKAHIPEGAPAQIMLALGSIRLVDKSNAEAFVTYFSRFPLEVKMLWARQFKTRLENVMGVAAFRTLLVENHWVFG